MKPGIYEMTNNEYKAAPGESRSQFASALKSRGHWELYKDKFFDTSPSKELGSLIHAMILEPEKVSSMFLDKPKMDRRSKLGKDQWADFEMRCAEEGKLPKDDAMFSTAENICNIIRNDEITKKIMYGYKERAFFWVDEETGTLCKCKPDICNLSALLITDIKSTRDASPYQFMKSVYDYSYEIQNAFYVDGIRESIKQSTGAEHNFNFLFLAIESSAPHNYSFYELPEDFVDSGRKKYKEALKRIKFWRNHPWKQEERKYHNEIVMLKPKAYQYTYQGEINE